MTVAVLVLAVLKDAWCFGVVGGVRVKKRVRRKKGALPIFPVICLCSMVENNFPLNNVVILYLASIDFFFNLFCSLFAVKHEMNTFAGTSNF